MQHRCLVLSRATELVSILVLAVACTQPKLARRDVGTPRARQADVFETPTGYHHEAILYPYDRVVDEATLISAPPGDTCIAVTMRSVDDIAIGDYAPVIVVNHERLTPTIAGEQADGETCADNVCTTTRRARLCAKPLTTSQGAQIELRMVHPYLVYRSDVVANRVERYELVFTWRLAD